MKRKVYGGEYKTGKRGCFLNGAAKILSSFRRSNNVEGSVASIAADVMNMEESLHGLIVGPFFNSSFRNRWRKRLEEAASLSEIKACLLEFERNIRDIAFSTDWIRHVDDTGSESQLSQSAKSVVGSIKKRGRKPSIVIRKIPYADLKDLSTDFAWWRGGMLSKHMIKHAAQQGGCKKINGVHYGDSLEVLKRSKQFIWQAAVDLSQTASELALQIRYLDLHVRWNELVYPEQPLQDGKGLELEASAFKNACITDKKKMGNKLSYGVVFENQKRLPSRVAKKVLKVEETRDKKSKNWFFEMHIPLYLIKEYEMVAAADVKLSTSDIKHVTKSSKLSKKQLQASGKNLFSFLEQKRENMGNVFCTFCQHDVSFGVAARCSACQGYCHDQCAVGTYNIETAARIEFLVTCKRCYDVEKDVTSTNEIVADSPTSPLLSQGQESQHSTSLIQAGKQNGHEKTLEQGQESQHSTSLIPAGKQNAHERPLEQGQESQHSTPLIQVGKQNGHERPLEQGQESQHSTSLIQAGKQNGHERSLEQGQESQHSTSLIQAGKQNVHERPLEQGQESQHLTSLIQAGKQNGHERPLEQGQESQHSTPLIQAGKQNAHERPLEQGQESQHSTPLIQAGKQNAHERPLEQGQESQHSTSLIRAGKQNGHERPLEQGQESQHSTPLIQAGKQNAHERPLEQGQESQHSTTLIQAGKQNVHERPLEQGQESQHLTSLIQAGKQNAHERPLEQGQESQHLTSLIQAGKQNGHESPLENSNLISSGPEIGSSGNENSKNQPLQAVDQKPEVFNSSKGSIKKNKKICLGLKWKKRNPNDTGTEFRKNNILLKGNPNGRSLAPTCHLCKQPYNSDLMYIQCESCKNWFHAESVDLQESKVIKVFGYKCCRCRRIRIPICPYMIMRPE